MPRLPQRYYQKGLLTGIIVTEWYDQAYRDDRKITWEDLDETVLAAGGLAWVWWEEAAIIAAAPLLPTITTALFVGAGISTIIGGEEGLYDYIDFIESGPTGWVEKTEEVIIPAITETVTETIDDAVMWGEFLVRTAESIWEYRIQPRVPWQIFRQPSFW
jgi:hypothetical protein